MSIVNEMAYWLFSHTNKTGRRRTPAEVSASWQLPFDDAASPTQHTATRSSPRMTDAWARPAAWGSWVAIGDDPVMMLSRLLPQWLGIWRPPQLGSSARASTARNTSYGVIPRV